MRTSRTVVAVVVCFGALLVAQPGHAQTTRTLVVTPDSELVSGDVVTLTGSGFNPGPVGVCELVLDATPGRDDCGFVASFSADASGEFSGQFKIRRHLNTSSAGAVDCAAPSTSCGMAASEIDGDLNVIPGTTVVAPIELREFAATGQPDIIIKNRKTGAFSGDDFYGTICCLAPQYRARVVAPGGKWSYALRVQNDDVAVDDLVITATPDPRVRYFVAYYDITALVTGGGFRYTDVGPGEVLPLAMQMSAVGLLPGDSYALPVTVASGAARERIDVAWLSVAVTSPHPVPGS